MNYVDVCTGIDAASVAWAELGWRCAAVAEIEPFPCAVLADRFGASRPQFMPQVGNEDSEETAREKRAAIKAVSKLPEVGRIPNRGDFTTMQGDEYGAVDLLVGGTPCQDFSVAGLRAGMDGKRGQLTVEFAKLAHRLAAKARTRWVLWENVPGVLSIDDGEAFATFLGILAKRSVRVPEGGWANSGIVAGGDDSFGLAYRVCDAQHFGVPQRRRRVFVVGYFGDWRRAAAVLFERHSLSGNSAPRREKGKRVAGSLSARSEGGGGLGTDFECAGGGVEHPVCMSTGQAGAEIGIGTTLNCNHEAPIVTHVTPPLTSNPYGDHESREGLLVTHSLRGEGFDASEDGTGRGTPLVPVGIIIHGTDKTARVASFTDVAGALRARTPGSQENSFTTAVLAFTSKDHGADAGDISPTLRSMGHDGSHANGGGQVAVAFRTNAAGQVDEQGSRTASLTTQTDPSSHFIAIQNATRGKEQNGLGISDDGSMYTLDQGSQHGVAFAMNLRGRDGGAMPELDELASIRAASGGSSRSYVGHAIGWSEELTASVDLAGTVQRGGDGGRHEGVMTPTMAVRRLLPSECSRIQGFPDGFLDITYNGKPAADGPKYKALGNSMAVPCMRWLGERIQMVEDLCNQKGEVIHGRAN